jgi:hypothetical protein
MEPNVLQTVAHLRISFSSGFIFLESPVTLARDSNPEILPNGLADYKFCG